MKWMEETQRWKSKEANERVLLMNGDVSAILIFVMYMFHGSFKSFISQLVERPMSQ